MHNNSQIAEQSGRELGLAGRRAGALRAPSRGCAHARTLRAQIAQWRPASGWCLLESGGLVHTSLGRASLARDHFSVQTTAPALEWTRRNMGEVAIFLLLSTSAHFLPWCPAAAGGVAPRSRNLELEFESWKKIWFWTKMFPPEKTRTGRARPAVALRDMVAANSDVT